MAGCGYVRHGRDARHAAGDHRSHVALVARGPGRTVSYWWRTTRIAGVGHGSHGTRRAGRSDVSGLLCTVLQRSAGIHGVPRIRGYNARCIVDVLSDGQRALAAMD